MKEVQGFQFLIELEDYEPKIWRRYTVNSHDSLAVFVCDILALFKAKGYHLVQINGSDASYAFDDEYDGEDEPPKNILEYQVDDVFKNIGDTAALNYDFGDDWRFKITLEQITERILTPILLDGEGYGIVEDCGGVSMLAEKLKNKSRKFDIEKLREMRERESRKLLRAYERG